MNPPHRPASLDANVDWDRKYVAWNFLSLETLGTIEYRQGLFSSSPRDAVRWITLALTAVHLFLEDDLDVLHDFQLRGRNMLPPQELKSEPLLARCCEYLTISHPTLDVPTGYLD